MTQKKAAPARETAVIEFRGERFELDKTLYRSLRFQTAMGLAQADPARHAGALNLLLDELCMGDLLGYLARIPGEDGGARDTGCTEEDWAAFLSAAAEALSPAPAKN